MKKLFGAILLLAAIAPMASAQSIQTLYAWNNFGNVGNAVYLDATVGGTALIVTAFDTNTSALVSFGFTVFTRPGSAAGFENTLAGWTEATTGTGMGMGSDNASPVTLVDTFELDANATTGIALVMDGVEHRYTNGDVGSGYGGGGNQTYSNADIQLDLGSATNVPFTGGVFNPRIWNGEMYYTPVPEPATMAILGLGLVALLRRRRNKKA